MCGIAGILLDPARTDPRLLAAIGPMAMRLRHRGPDGDGFWIDEGQGVALAHRRLAIIDLSDAGRQPMASHDDRLIVTYNGEIYNFAGLRTEFIAAGQCFRGHSDTEVMLAAFLRFGVAATLQRLAGMFAIGLWDRQKRTLHLIRDRLGKKPLYVALSHGALLFASELKALSAFPGFEPELDRGSLDLMLRQGWIPDHRCIWANVVKIPPGGMLSVRPEEISGLDADGLKQRMHIWWSLPQVAEQGQQQQFHGDNATIEELDRLLRTAVRERMVADVPLGALLSGGIDSTTVVALMQAQSSRPVRTFTIGYAETRYDEAGSAARLARHLSTEHTELRLTAEEALATIPDLPRIWDEPFADESQIPTLLVCQLARQHVTVALSGDGGDESFGGYSRYLLPGRLAAALALPRAVRRTAAAAMLAADSCARRLPTGIPGLHLSRAHVQKLGFALQAESEQDFYDRLVATSQSALPRDPAGNARPGAFPILANQTSRLIYRDMAGYLPGDILVKLDRASMAVSLEGRCPLLDHRVIEFAWRLPLSAKIRDGQGKWILRQVLRRYVPEALFDRPKHGFDVPIADWLRGPLRDWAGDLLSPSRLGREGFVDPAQAQRLWREHQKQTHDHAGALWAILMFEAWLDVARDARTPATPAGLFTAENGPPAYAGAAWLAPRQVGAENDQ